jgi:HAD superfamily hydrolase (TIGR01490 family)
MSANPQLHRVSPSISLAVFDLDGTITARDTLFPFLRHVCGAWAFCLRLALVLPILAAMALRIVGRDRAKELVLSIYLRGRSRAELEACGESFARDKLPALLRPAAMSKLASHAARGDRCVVASASLGLYVEPWARAAGFDEIVTSQLEFDAAGFATGRLAGRNCRGAEKLARLEALYGDLGGLSVCGYGDSEDDRPFLSRCTESHYRPFRAEADPAVKPAAHNGIGDFIKLMRPHQWAKNGFVFIGVLFGHAWTDPRLLLAAVLAACAFCLIASAVYIVNDLVDRERDRVHPKKRNRPLASGRVSVGAALVLAAVLTAGALGLAGAASPVVLAIVAGYAVMNLAYTYVLKSVVILDVFVIAAGFILRILAGTLGIDIAPSQWLLVCSLFLTLFLGFTKRRSELLVVGSDFLIHRKALLQYNAQLLDKMIGVCAAAALMSYSLYTMSPATVRAHGTENLIYTIPFVAYGLFRYLYLLHTHHAGGDTARDLARDPHLIGTVLGWGAATAWLIS